MSSTHVQINHSQGRSHKLRARFSISSSTCGIDFKLCQICWDDRLVWLIWIDDIIMGTTWCRYNFQTKNKIWTRLCNQSLPAVLTSNFVSVRLTKELHQWRHHGCHVTFTVSRPDREWGLVFVYQIAHTLLTSNFSGYILMAKKLTSLRASWWHMSWLQFKDQKQKSDQDLSGLL